MLLPPFDYFEHRRAWSVSSVMVGMAIDTLLILALASGSG
jgi:hypothetical protein